MKNDNRQRIESIWRFGKKYIWAFLIGEICIIVSYVVSILLPLNLTKLTDEVLYGNRIELLPRIIMDYIFLFLLATVFNFLYAFIWQYLNNNYVLNIKNSLFEKILYAKASFLSSMSSGDLMERIDYDAEQFIHVVQRNLFHFINSILMCLGIVYVVAKVNFTISIMLTISTLLPIILIKLCSKYTERYSKEQRDLSGEMSSKLYEFINGLREIKLFVAEHTIFNKIFDLLKRLIFLGNNIRFVDFFANKLIYLVNLCTSIIIYAYSVSLVARGEMTVGLFLAIIEYIALLHKKFNWILRIYLDWFNRKISIDRVNEVLKIESESGRGEKVINIDSVEFKSVDFAYKSENIILNDLNFKILKGEKVGIVGGSGNGKTTIISLLLGLYSVDNGEILINGTNIQNINIKSLRENIGIVSQDIVIFEDTIRYNLDLKGQFKDEELFEALKAVDLIDVISNLPQGLDTLIDGTSYNLSGGQMQRLMIAKMILKKPEFIILDEATSALDFKTEKSILKYLTSFSDNTTLLIISHRPEAIEACDKVLVLDEHKIVAEGTHNELLKCSKIYSKLFGGDCDEN